VGFLTEKFASKTITLPTVCSLFLCTVPTICPIIVRAFVHLPIFGSPFTTRNIFSAFPDLARSCSRDCVRLSTNANQALHGLVPLNVLRVCHASISSQPFQFGNHKPIVCIHVLLEPVSDLLRTQWRV
jgi:hypothetical protein